MATGVLIIQSLALGTRLDVPSLTVTRVSRVSVANPTPTQPHEWALIYFTVDDDRSTDFANSLAGVLDPHGHWYADFGTPEHHFVVFPNKVFTYRVGDAEGRANAERFGESLGIPRAQLDWQD